MPSGKNACALKIHGSICVAFLSDAVVKLEKESGLGKEGLLLLKEAEGLVGRTSTDP